MPVKLHVNDVSLSFGGIKALQNVDFKVEAGDIFAVIGPNGAGKTSLINSINGFYAPQNGTILFEGRGHNAYAALQARCAGHFPHISKHCLIYQCHGVGKLDGGAS